MTPTELKKRGDKFREANRLLRHRVVMLEREVREVRSVAFKAGSAVAFQDAYRAVGVGLSDMLAICRGRKSVLDPVIDEMIAERTNDLLVRVGLRRIK